MFFGLNILYFPDRWRPMLLLYSPGQIRWCIELGKFKSGSTQDLHLGWKGLIYKLQWGTDVWLRVTVCVLILQKHKGNESPQVFQSFTHHPSQSPSNFNTTKFHHQLHHLHYQKDEGHLSFLIFSRSGSICFPSSLTIPRDRGAPSCGKPHVQGHRPSNNATNGIDSLLLLWQRHLRYCGKVEGQHRIQVRLSVSEWTGSKWDYVSSRMFPRLVN